VTDPDVEALADLFMDLRLDGPAAEGWTYQQTARHYARIILGRWLGGIRQEHGWWHPAGCIDVHDENHNCLDADGSIIGWRDWRPAEPVPVDPVENADREGWPRP
jgi:hypothetical protein